MGIKIYKYFLFILLLLLVFIKAEIKIEEISFDNEETKFDNLGENKYYHIKAKSPSDIANYLKIMVKDNKGNKNSYLNFVNFVISFYQGDNTFSDRKQLSYGSLNSTTMWLTKEQVKGGFYLSIETAYSSGSCDYSLIIYQKNVAELLPGEQYSYYVTEENKKMIFSVKKENFEAEAESYITFWALGNNNIESSIKGNYSNYANDIKKHPNYNAYIIKVENKNYEYNITITGTPGNNIKIGNLACSNKECKISYFYEGVEYFGLLIKNYVEKVCFNKKVLPDRGFEFLIYDDYLEKIDTTVDSSSNLICIEKPEGYTTVLYTLKSTRITTTQTGLIKTFPLTYSYNYSFTINNGETLRFFPLNLENFEYLTYNIFSQGGKKNDVFFFNCENYPLCISSKEIKKNTTPIQGAFWAYSISFNKKDFKDFSPISKNQKMVMFTCVGDLKCMVYPRLYNENSYIRIVPKFTEYRMVREGSEENLYLEDFEFVLIETVSGEISTKVKKLENKNY